MVSDATRNGVWQDYLDVVRLVYYYEALSDKYQRLYFWIRFALLISVIATVGLQFASLAQPISIAATMLFITAILVALYYVGSFAKKNAVLHWISIEVKHLESDWEMLRTSLDYTDAGDGDILRRNSELHRLLAEATVRAGEAGLAADHRVSGSASSIRIGALAATGLHTPLEATVKRSAVPRRPSTSPPAPPPQPRPRPQPQPAPRPQR